MKKKFIRFSVVSILLLSAPYYMAYASDTFSTMVVALPALLYFFSGTLFSLARCLQKKEVRYHLIRFSSSLVLMFSLVVPLNLSDHGLRELTRKRMAIIKELRPVFIQYCSDNGHYPRSLDELVPVYIPAIPDELVNDGESDGYKKITYDPTHGPIFYFRTMRGPDSAASLDVVDGTYWHDR